MAINRTLDFYTQMGPADVILAGYFEDNPDATGLEDFLRVTPATCEIEALQPAPGDFRYRLTLPGTGELRVAGVCMECSPTLVEIANQDVIWAKWDYNASERSIYIELRNQGGPASPGLALPAGYRLYFTAHVYPSSEQQPNIVVEQ